MYYVYISSLSFIQSCISYIYIYIMYIHKSFRRTSFLCCLCTSFSSRFPELSTYRRGTWHLKIFGRFSILSSFLLLLFPVATAASHKNYRVLAEYPRILGDSSLVQNKAALVSCVATGSSPTTWMASSLRTMRDLVPRLDAG